MAFCRKISAKVKALLSKFDKVLKENVDTALTITTVMKQFLESGFALTITDLIPGNVDEFARLQTLKVLEKVIENLNIVRTCKDKTGTEKVKCFLVELRKLHPDLQEAILLKTASRLAAKFDGERYKQNVYDSAAQVAFSLGKK